METRKKIVIISHDYDECADILFDDILVPTIYEYSLAIPPSDLPRVEKCRAKLKKYHEDITAGADVVEFYVGSNRQDITKDEVIMEQNKNGSCFTNFKKLCAENGWVFREFLLADAQKQLEPGTTMRSKDIESVTNRESKAAIIQAQLKDIEQNYSASDHIEFYFVDDDRNNIFLNSIKNSISPNNLPPQIKKFSLIQYDWNDAVYEYAEDAKLKVHTEHVISAEPACKDHKPQPSNIVSHSIFSKSVPTAITAEDNKSRRRKTT